MSSTPKINLSIEGMKVRALIDTRAQSRIISCTTLHKIAQLLKLQRSSLPVLEKPKVKLLGKADSGKYHELTITVQLNLTFAVDGKSIVVPTFVQTNSEQEFLARCECNTATGDQQD